LAEGWAKSAKGELSEGTCRAVNVLFKGESPKKGQTGRGSQEKRKERG